MRLDIRVPVGAMFTILGGLLVVYALLHRADEGMRPTGVPITLVWGAVMMAFGLAMFFFGRRAAP